MDSRAVGARRLREARETPCRTVRARTPQDARPRDGVAIVERMTRTMTPWRTLALVVLLGSMPAGIFACRSARRPARSVVLVTIDTLRRDRLSVYGYGRPTTPRIDALAARGAVFLDAWSQAPNTNPSIASALTSRRAPITTVRGNAEKLDPAVPTIARVARDAGWDTAAFVSTVLLRRDASALDGGFDVYDDEMTDPCWGHDRAQRVAGRTIDRALAWLSARDAADGRPFLLWVHLYDPHGPYTAPEPTPELDATAPSLPAAADESTWRGAQRIPRYLRVPALTTPLEYADAYDREIRYADRHLGRLLAALDLATTYVAVHADHGESLGENAYWFRHGTLLHDSALRIPMVVAGPGIGAGRRSSLHVGNLDLAPTLARLAGMPPLPGAEGRDLSPHLLRGDDAAPAWFVAEARRRELVKDDTGIDVRWKLRHTDDAGIDVTWWPAADERRVRGGTPGDVATAMERMRAWLRGPQDAGPSAITPEMENALRGLGYATPAETVTPSSPSSPPSPRRR